MNPLDLLDMPKEVPAPRVLNRHWIHIADLEFPENNINIGRPTKFGNPFKIGPGCTRAEAIERFEAWIQTQPELLAAAKRELKGKNLLCYCAPQACHGDVLLRIANS